MPIPTREVLEAALWILNTGVQWHMLPQCYPHYKTVHQRFQQSCEREVLIDLANALRERGDIDERESFIDATFASTKSGGDAIGRTRRGKGGRSSPSWTAMCWRVGEHACGQS